jgi:hypothetical protein
VFGFLNKLFHHEEAPLTTDLDLVSRGDIAERSGWPDQTISVWILRHSDNEQHPFPAPVGFVAGARVWRWEEVEHWLRATNRLKEKAS